MISKRIISKDHLEHSPPAMYQKWSVTGLLSLAPVNAGISRLEVVEALRLDLEAVVRTLRYLVGQTVGSSHQSGVKLSSIWLWRMVP